MRNPIICLSMLWLIACKSENSQHKSSLVSTDKPIVIASSQVVFDNEVQDSISKLSFNLDDLNKLSEAERAAITYASFSAGNECWWDGNALPDRSNLLCPFPSALNLGYQCSESHIGLLRKWFSKDVKTLEKIKSCPTSPETSTILKSIESLQISSLDTVIYIKSEIVLYNFRQDSRERWIQTDIFNHENNSLMFIRSDRSDYSHSRLNMSEQ